MGAVYSLAHVTLGLANETKRQYHQCADSQLKAHHCQVSTRPPYPLVFLYDKNTQPHAQAATVPRSMSQNKTYEIHLNLAGSLKPSLA